MVGNALFYLTVPAVSSQHSCFHFSILRISDVPLITFCNPLFFFCTSSAQFHLLFNQHRYYVGDLVLIIEFGWSGHVTCDLLSAMLQMGAGVHSHAAGVSSPPADLQSASSQPPFPNSPQVRSQTGLRLVCGSCMLLI